MPCYRPDEGLLTSLASISAQTWGELEIVVVDDASGPGYAEIFERALATEDRARLLRLDRNGGSYLARNAALAQARGELITVQDADDWSHPRRIEHQARALLDDPAAPASRSLAVRARDDLTHQWFGYRAVRDNASSLMVRRTVIDRIGPFAPIRKGADSEYAERLTSQAGPLLDTGSPLAITRLRAGTLSRGDFTYQWASPERLAFKGTYRAWHRQEGVPDPGRGLPFPVPRTFLRGLDSFPDWDRLAVAYLGDLSQDPTHDGMAPDLDLLDPSASGQRDAPAGPAQQGDAGRTGLWHLEAVPPAAATRTEMHDGWFDRIVRSDGRLVPLTRLEDVRVQLLVVLDPRVLVLAGAQPCRVRVDEVEVWLEPSLLHPDRSGLPVDLLTVADVCSTWFGRRPRWVPAPHLDEVARAELGDLVPGLLHPCARQVDRDVGSRQGA
nr:glycosyltransferase family A protein [Ornithinimicrobium sp. F0845]